MTDYTALLARLRMRERVAGHYDLAARLDAAEAIEALQAERDKLQAYKTWTHDFLDRHGVPHHPPGTHGAAGCRIGDRMDWLMAELAKERAEVAALKAKKVAQVCTGPCEACGGTGRVSIPRGEPSQGKEECPCLDCGGTGRAKGGA